MICDVEGLCELVGISRNDVVALPSHCAMSDEMVNSSDRWYEYMYSLARSL